jgi:uncharacterized membrane protein (UPF0127 family)
MEEFLNSNKILIFPLILLLAAGCNHTDDNHYNTTTLEVEKKIIQIEIADSPQEWEMGLSYRDTLAGDIGMFFVFPNERRRVFWMRGCNFDIDLAYIESDGIISEIITMKKEPLNTPPESLTTYPSQSTTIKYALEMIGGWFEDHNINANAKVNLDQFSD